MVQGTDWSALVTQLYELPGTTQTDTQEYAEYGRSLGTTASVQAVQQVLANAGIQASAQWKDNVCKIRLFHASDRTRAESILAESCGELPYEIESGGNTP